tara:strand:+ start:9845 stop:10078 length:234 start_codon:yes stop_codon:yes gene_type:complete
MDTKTVIKKIQIVKAFILGVTDAMDPEISLGMTFDDDAESPRSRAYDRGCNLGERITLTCELWGGGPLSPIPEWLTA